MGMFCPVTMATGPFSRVKAGVQTAAEQICSSAWTKEDGSPEPGHPGKNAVKGAIHSKKYQHCP